MDKRFSAVERLVRALKAAHAPQVMIDRAASGYYDDFMSPIATPIMQLVHDARALGLHRIAQRAINGDFDAERWEAIAWAKTPEGEETLGRY